MSVFRDVKLSYDGEEYWLTPSNRLLRRIESEMAPSSLTDMISRISHGKPPVSEVALVVTEFLREAGVPKVNEDQMYADLMNDLQDGGKVFGAMCEAIVMAISPSDDAGKKSAPRASKPKATGKRAK